MPSGNGFVCWYACVLSPSQTTTHTPDPLQLLPPPLPSLLLRPVFRLPRHRLGLPRYPLPPPHHPMVRLLVLRRPRPPLPLRRVPPASRARHPWSCTALQSRATWSPSQPPPGGLQRPGTPQCNRRAYPQWRLPRVMGSAAVPPPIRADEKRMCAIGARGRWEEITTYDGFLRFDLSSFFPPYSSLLPPRHHSPAPRLWRLLRLLRQLLPLPPLFPPLPLLPARLRPHLLARLRPLLSRRPRCPRTPLRQPFTPSRPPGAAMLAFRRLSPRRHSSNSFCPQWISMWLLSMVRQQPESHNPPPPQYQSGKCRRPRRLQWGLVPRAHL